MACNLSNMAPVLQICKASSYWLITIPHQWKFILQFSVFLSVCSVRNHCRNNIWREMTIFENIDSKTLFTLAFGVGCGVCITWLMKGKVTNVTRTANLSTGTRNDWSSTLPAASSGIFSDTGEYKMILVVRTDLKMGKGKVAAQCCHAAVNNYRKISKKNSTLLQLWEASGQPKVCVKTDTQESLLELSEKAKAAGLITSVIRDAGRTQIPSGSMTVLGVGPGPASLIDTVTGHLKLY